jgi:hypothetical protein
MLPAEIRPFFLLNGYLMKFSLRMLPALVCFGMVTVQAQTITNYTSPKAVYDFISFGQYIWAGTSGGFCIHDLSSGISYLRPTTADFPDPSIRALAIDSLHNMWAASADGYLMRRDKDWNEYLNSSYVSAGWGINALSAYGNYLIVGSNKGVSLFDVKKKIAVKNAQHISTYTSAQIYTLAIYKNHLYVGGESGSARLKVKLSNLSDANFYDPSLWEIDSSVAPVHSFYEDSGKFISSSVPTGRLFGVLFKADSSNLLVPNEDSIVHIDLGSRITKIKTIDYYHCLIGTEANYFYLWDQDSIRMIFTPGPTFASANRVHVDRSGKLWVLPYGQTGWHDSGNTWYPMPWWLGINSYSSSGWENHSPMVRFGMGHMMNATDANGIAESRDGRMWFGFNGGSIKCFDPQSNEWLHYCNFGGQEGNGAFVVANGPCPETDYGKCDAIAQDSTGYMWYGSYNNDPGCLICYKPTPGETDSLESGTSRELLQYRRFPPYGTGGLSITEVAVDAENNILFGTDDGILRVIHHDGDPIKDSIRLVKEFHNLQNIFRIVVLDNGNSMVLTAEGMYLFDPEELTLNPLGDFEKGITTMAAENDNLIWYGVNAKGVVRFDLLNNTKTVFGKAQGLVANQINDVFVDRYNGAVWVASDRGVSRITLGYALPTATDMPPVVVFPNPYSLRRHNTVYLRHVPADAKVGIYALNGNLVGKPVEVIGNERGSAYEWKPSSNCVPGTYFYSVVTTTTKKTGTILIVP